MSGNPNNIQSCGNCEYHHEGICNAGKIPMSDLENTCPEFEQVDLERRKVDTEKVNRTVERWKQQRTFMFLLNLQSEVMYSRYGIRPKEFLIHPQTLADEIARNRFVAACITPVPVFVNLEDIRDHDFSINIAGMKAIASIDMPKNTVKVLVPDEVLFPSADDFTISPHPTP